MNDININCKVSFDELEALYLLNMGLSPEEIIDQAKLNILFI